MAAFLANENVPGDAVHAARRAGFDVAWMMEIAPGTKDPGVIACALSQRRILLTFDKDFGELAFRAGLSAAPGVILFRPKLQSPDYLARFVVADLSKSIAWEGNFCVATEGRIRVTRMPT